jgi:O-antigen/teichoic acid export membrane protein
VNQTEHKKQTVSGLKWNMLNQLIGQGLSILVNIIMMRLLKPEDFGLIGMITVFSGFLVVFRNFGLGNSLIQKQSTDKLDEDTIFWTNVSTGLLFTLLLVLLAPVISNFYNEPLLVGLIYAISITFLIQSLGTIQDAILKKKMLFKKLFFVNTISIVIASTIALFSAYMGLGVWALIAQQVTIALVSVVILWIISPWKPKFQFCLEKLKCHLGFGASLVGSQSVGYWTRNADNLLIGKFLGADSLGFTAALTQ